jgi:alkylhydroperoxidase/carboxymuconolactone decarboxylase family protein YurZ
MPKPPEFYEDAKKRYPALFSSYEALGKAAKEAGPLDAKTAALVKLALALGAGFEGAAHSGARKALAAGASAEELRHVAILGVTTIGFPAMMRARAWVEDVLKD